MIPLLYGICTFNVAPAATLIDTELFSFNAIYVPSCLIQPTNVTYGVELIAADAS